MERIVRTRRTGLAAIAVLLGVHTGMAGAQDATTFDATPVFQSGLATAIDTLNETDAPSAGEKMALGGAVFLRGVERALQSRWRVGAVRGFDIMPILRLDLPENPDPEPVSGARFEQIFADLIDDMATSRAALEGIADDAAFGVEIDLAALWFDINMNGARDDGEAVVAIAGEAFTRRLGRLSDEIEQDGLVVRFDLADAAWLTAYAHVLSGVAHMALAFDPEPVIDQVLADSDDMSALLPGQRLPESVMGERDVGNAIAILIDTLGQQPDTDHTRAAHAAFLAMVAENRRFWARLSAETDNDREWIPNPSQTSALPLEFPDELGDRWIDVLADAEAVLQGELLIRHWQYPSDAVGINARAWFEDPSPVDLIDWIHGRGLLPYAEKGALVSDENWRRFNRLVAGQSGLFAILLN